MRALLYNYSRFMLMMRNILCTLAVIMLFCNCKKAYIQFGGEFVDNGTTNIVLVDTITPLVSTIYRDSVSTSGSGTLLVGSYRDSLFGSVTCKSFMNVVPPTITTLNFSASARFDSIRLILKPNKSYYGDTINPQPINVYQLAAPIQLGETQFLLYNNSDFPINPTPIGSISRTFHPSDTSSIQIPLNDALGQQLFDLVVNKADQVKTAADFIAYFNGLQVAPGTGPSTSVFGFSDSVTMRVYYHEANPSPVSKAIDFAYANKNLQFNQIHYDRTGTLLEPLNPTNLEMPSSQMGNMGFVQTATGIVAKIRFPTLRNLLQRPDYAKIVRAELDIEPIRGTYVTHFALPPQLEAYTTTVLNQPLAPITAPAINGQLVNQMGNLTIDWIYGQNTMYSYDVTAYLQQQIVITDNNKNGLLLQPSTPAFNSSLNRLVFGDSDNPNNSIKLKVYYISIQP
ncbi:MAG: hypothetical protein C5B52_13300 [Bacteroidetes bacterium]|nr:MAG: hypothetical protein C5B52_13300 [Bacteroidota bacterium]